MPATVSRSYRSLKRQGRARQNVHAIPVFNAGDDPVDMKHPSGSLVFQPGLNEVRDIYGVSDEVSIKRRADKKYGDVPEEQKTRLIARAEDVSDHARRRLGARGVVVLTGDAAEDEKLKADARKTWLSVKAAEMRKIADGYKHVLFVARTQGKAARPATDAETSADLWLLQYEGGIMSTLRKHVCPHFKDCGFHVDDPAMLDLHVRGRHGDMAAPAEGAAPKTRSRKPKAAATEEGA